MYKEITFSSEIFALFKFLTKYFFRVIHRETMKSLWSWNFIVPCNLGIQDLYSFIIFIHCRFFCLSYPIIYNGKKC